MTIGHLTAAGDGLVEAVGGADLDAPVPGLDWSVREVAVHTGAVHRWAADIIGRRLPDNRTGGSKAFLPTDLADPDLPAWLFEGVIGLVAAIDAAPEDLECFTFALGPARAFWVRRQVHETTVHRIDVEAGAGRIITPVPAEVARDGLAELVGGFATEPGLAIGTAATLLLTPTDGAWWRIDLGGARTRTRSGVGPPPASDAVIRGAADQLYRWAWNRPAEVEIDGDPEAAALWRLVRI